MVEAKVVADRIQDQEMEQIIYTREPPRGEGG